MRELPYYMDDPAMDEARKAHRLQMEPADDERFQRYTACCSCGSWEAGRPLDAHAAQEEFDVHMGDVQQKVHAPV
ncbi:hypothetical protein ACIRPQ_29285 [Streptomyces sp. NPDC101213]|uniref:hypothetical protein n=1 Tax=Streptomyces sp. NPDC101213 TaxID=3366130 RepID=UPI003806A9A6